MLAERMSEFIAKNNLIAEGVTVGAAVSGGADSMAMLYALRKLGFSVCALHFEHGIRGAASVKDMRFVERYCAENGIAFLCERADVPALAERGESVEAAARRLRYDFFARAAREHGIGLIATAHHADDNAETFFLNLLRGGGMTGLSGMSAKRPPNIIRPLLFAKRGEIEEYCEVNGIPFVTDETNSSVDYTRNYIRHEILPRLKEVNPRYTDAIARTQELLREENEALAYYAEQEYAALADQENDAVRLDICGLQKLSAGMLKRVLRKAIDAVDSLKNIEKQHVDAIVELVRNPETGKKFLIPEKFSAIVSYNSLIIAKKTYKINKIECCDLPLNGLVQIGERGWIYSSAAERACFGQGSDAVQYFDREALDGAVIRSRRQGDVFHALGAAGKKKLKDWLIDKKIPAADRDALILAARGNEILWIVGYAVSETSRIKQNSGNIIKLEYISKELSEEK